VEEGDPVRDVLGQILAHVAGVGGGGHGRA
jgi:hypothetical protein